MGKLSRRDFLKFTKIGAGSVILGWFLQACGKTFPVPTPSVLSTESSAPQNTLESPSQIYPSTNVSPTLPSASTPPPYLVVTQGGEPEDLVRNAIGSLGGMEKFIPVGAKVVIKPNICVAYHTYEYAATTNPWVVGALVKMAFEAGAASVKVMDLPFGGTQPKAYEISGIKEQVETSGGEMVNMLPYKFIPTQIPGAVVLKETNIYEDILKADILINVPIAKQHGSSRLSLGMKNLMGVIKDRSALHVSLGQSIADLNSLVKPQLTVVDAVRILTANGPTGGNLADVRQLDTVIASADVVAADSFAASLFGLQPEDLDFVVYGTSMGLGRSDLQNMDIQVNSLNS
jgi:uncharacterized protein (DUF362 family)